MFEFEVEVCLKYVYVICDGGRTIEVGAVWREGISDVVGCENGHWERPLHITMCDSGKINAFKYNVGTFFH